MKSSEISLPAHIANELYTRHGAILDGAYVEFNGIESHVGMDYTPERSGKSTWSMGRLTGRTRVTVGGYGSKRGFREKNDGTHSYDKIADAVFEQYEANLRNEKSRIERSQRSNNTHAIKEKLAEEFNIYDWTSMSVTKYGRLTLKFDSNLTEDNTRQLLKLAMELGVIKPKG